MTVKPPLIGIRHVALYSENLAASERFWIDVMGYVIEWRPDDDNLYLTAGTDNLALHRRKGDATGPGALDHIGLAVGQPDDVEAWAAHLKENGVRLEHEPKQHRDGSSSLYFREPGGVLVQIIHHKPLAG